MRKMYNEKYILKDLDCAECILGNVFCEVYNEINKMSKS